MTEYATVVSRLVYKGEDRKKAYLTAKKLKLKRGEAVIVLRKKKEKAK